jgi:hypothetical protein
MLKTTRQNAHHLRFPVLQSKKSGQLNIGQGVFAMQGVYGVPDSPVSLQKLCLDVL